ncbi:MAG: leucine-rich repeat domain-containing protein, partial [Candidatus Poribacteria bacterium]|nr:leucine-rich repeat domain-containing protein [Candidatus Poribacteria bacterium]
LSGLVNLTELWIGGNQISDVSPLSGLVNLTELWIGGNQISDVSPLSDLTDLTSLSLSENVISDVSPLAGLTNLTYLGLAYNNISDFTSLDGLKETGVQITTHGQGFVEISKIGYSPSDAGLSVSVSGISQGKFKVETGFQEELTYTVLNKDGEAAQGITLSLLAFSSSSSEVRFYPSTITTDAKGQATTLIIIDRAGEFDLWANMKVSQKTTNQHGNTVYKHYDGNETVLIKGLELSDVNAFTYDHTQFHPPRHGKHFRIYGQGDANTCGQTSARMVLSYYGVDVGLHTFDDVADIHTWVVGATPDEMRAGLRLLPVDLETYSGTSENYPRDQSLRDKISESRPPILVIRVAKNGYHHVVVVGYDTRTNSFLIADPGVKGYFHWMPWKYLNSEWRLDYVPGLTWEDYWKDFTDLNKLGSAPFVPDVKFVIKWFGGLAPYRMFVPEEAPPYHHLESKTVQIYETGDVEWDPFEWGWHDWKREETFDGKVIATSWFAERRNGDVREVRREGNKVIVSGRISNGVPLDTDIPFVDDVFYGAVDMVLTAYYDPSVRAAPSVVFPPLSKETVLLPNYPNPFNPETWIPYHLAEPADVTLTIYSVDGKVVRRLDLGHQDTGYYQSKARAAYWDGRNSVGERVASGLYFYTLTAGDFAATRKMLIMK